MAASTPYDVIIVGYGPAGITAAIYAARKKLRVLLIGDLPGGEVKNSGEIENWPGDGHTDGIALADKFVNHLKLHESDVTIVTDKVTQITRDASTHTFSCTTGNTTTHVGKTIIYTTGRHPRLLNIPGESDYKNRGVTYCATCDAPLFPDKEVAVIGGGNTGAEAVIMLQRIAKKIHLLHINKQLTADPILVANFVNDPKVNIIYEAKTLRIEGSLMAERLIYQDAASQEQSLNVQGIFVAIGAIPNTEPIKDLLTLDTFGAIPTDRYGVTEIPGFFAAGDVTNIRDAQIVVAAGHGCSAALSASDYLSRQTTT